MKHLLNYILIFIFFNSNSCASKRDIVDVPVKGGYLFAHMKNADYGGMYYAVSEDGINWTELNAGGKINEYRGHPDFCLGRDGRYYMIGVEAGTGQPLLWETRNLIGWGVEKQLPKAAFDLSTQGHATEQVWYGAPKMYYDKDSDKYIITWHAAKAGLTTNGNEEHDKPYWQSIRTFYILTADFKEFTTPQRLFNFTGADEDMATMDAIIRKIDGKYYSFVKDERWPEDVAESAKAIRITKSNNLTGPYENPGPAITANWREAQTLVPKPDNNGWYLFVEQYPLRYDLYEAPSIEGPWTHKEIQSPDARHGSMIWVDGATYQAITRAYK